MTIRARVEVVSERQVKRAIARAGVNGERAMRGAVYSLGQFIMRNSVLLVPTDTGRLKGTHFVTIPRGKKHTTYLGYGTEYAERVHEVPANHNPPTRDKYLEIPFQAVVPRARKLIAGWAWQFLRSGGGIDDVEVDFPTKMKDKGPEWQKQQRKRNNRRKGVDNR